MHNMNDALELLANGLNKWGITADNSLIQKFEQYLDLLVEWNKKFNLTAIKDEKDIVIYHFLDSLSILSLDLPLDRARIMDIGTGAGFPGLPLKLVFPEMDLVLVDSVKKKTLFLNEVIRSLGMHKAEAFHMRAEELDNSLREGFDIVVSRAVAEMRIISEYCLPYVKVNGYFVAYKGPGGDDEADRAQNAVKLLGGVPPVVETVEVPYSEKTHKLVYVKKVQNTSNKYPRAAGIPKKSPL